MHLLVGLGNPGTKYKKNRHNVGYMAIDVIREKYNLVRKTNNKFGELFEGKIMNKKTFALKPKEFMNLSGLSIKKLINFYKIKKENLLVVHDDIDLPLGKIKIKIGGGNAGHNGLKNIDSPSIKTKETSSENTNIKIPETDTVETTSEVIKFVDDVLIKAIKNGVSDIHVEHFRSEPRIRFRLDGVMAVEKEFNKFLLKNYPAVVTRLKIMAETNISERRLPQDGAIQFLKKNIECDFRVSFLPTKYGERVVLRLLKKEAIQLELSKLGFEKEQFEKITSSITAPQGLILVTGPTGSGKTTTLYSCLNHINKDDLNILTAEDPVEYELHGISQVQVKEDIGLTFASALRSFLRQDPEIILVGEIRDKETADIAIKAALTGHLVLSTLHTNDSISTITRLINMGVPSYLISSALTLVMGQRLARANCPSCKKPEQSNPKSLSDSGFSMEQASRISLYKSKGCAKCDNKGYKGRIGIYEVLKMTPKIQQAIINNASISDLSQIAKKEGFITMQEMGRRLLVEGKICLEEYQRVLQGEM